MGRGYHQMEFFHNGAVGAPWPEIYAALDEYTDEIFAENSERLHCISVYVIVPPVQYRGTRVKGILMTEAADLLVARFPRIQELFHICAFSMWSSIAWSSTADALCMPFANPAREAAFRLRHPQRAHQHIVPLFDSDWTNEYFMAPQPVAERDLDIVCVSRFDACKNLPVLAEALKILRSKHPERPMRMTLIPGRPLDPNFDSLASHERDILRSMTNTLGFLPDYVQLVPFVHQSELRTYYSRSKVYVIASLLEGKNRGALEAMACNTPVVSFQAHCQYSRGDTLLAPHGAGLMAPDYSPESLADTLYAAVTQHQEFAPREGFLKHYGRRNFFNTMVDAFPYYRTALPQYVEGAHNRNIWLDVAVQDNYQVGLEPFIYDANGFLSHPSGVEGIQETLGFYLRRFSLA